jgi:hypothetical protein
MLRAIELTVTVALVAAEHAAYARACEDAEGALIALGKRGRKLSTHEALSVIRTLAREIK